MPVPDTLRVLIVDDSDLMRYTIEQALRTSNLPRVDVVATARDGREALGAYREHLPDIVFSDLEMPGMNGLDFIEALVTEFPDARVVVVSGSFNESMRMEAITRGALVIADKKSVNRHKLGKLIEAIYD